ncbi:MAG: hypothetical protein CMJ46_05670 [Planctomyces sp.]|nr:hypothetical protein [Planctomyces sp.]
MHDYEQESLKKQLDMIKSAVFDLWQMDLIDDSQKDEIEGRLSEIGRLELKEKQKIMGHLKTGDEILKVYLDMAAK